MIAGKCASFQIAFYCMTIAWVIAMVTLFVVSRTVRRP
jgi:hypothetical protein